MWARIHLYKDDKTSTVSCNLSWMPRLFLLAGIEAGRLMPECWPNEIKFCSGKLYTGVGPVKVNWAQLQHYEWTILQWHNSLRIMDTQRRELDRLKVILSPADQLAITMRSRSVTRMAAKIKPDMHQLKKKILHRLIGC